MTDQIKAMLKDYKWFLNNAKESYERELESVNRAVEKKMAWPTTPAREQAGIDEMQRRIDAVDKVLSE